jgi:hypothetical protein
MGSFADDVAVPVDYYGADAWVWMRRLGAGEVVGPLKKPTLGHPVRRSMR